MIFYENYDAVDDSCRCPNLKVAIENAVNKFLVYCVGAYECIDHSNGIMTANRLRMKLIEHVK